MGKRTSKSGKGRKTVSVCSPVNVLKCLREILCTKPKRRRMKNDSGEFLKQCTIVFKASTKNRTIDFLEAHRAFFNMLKRKDMNKAPTTGVTQIQLERLTTAIIRYYEKLNIDWSTTHKTMSTFTAVVVSKLRTGYLINGITIFPKIEWISQHAPTDIQFSGIVGIQCRSMSIMWRKMQAAIISPASGLPSHTKIFSLA